MYWLQLQPQFNDLVVGTYGRGIWILDDVTPLQQLTNEVTASDMHLFQPRRAYRFRSITDPMAMFDDPSDGDNPSYGASINYWLKSVPDDTVMIRIVNADGDTIRTQGGKKKAGINRVWWNLETDSTVEMKLRMKPLYADWVDLGDDGWRPAPEGRWTMLAPPGTYTVVLEVGDERRTTELEVLKDPHSEGSAEDVTAQAAMLQELYADMNAAAEIVNRAEWVRRQLYDLNPLLEERGDAEDVTAAADSLDQTLIDVEGELIQLKLTGTGQDDVRWPAMLAFRIAWLASDVATGDFPPTDQAREVQEILEGRLEDRRQRFEEVMSRELARFNAMLAERGLGGIAGGERTDQQVR
jgi:hypothetical protein